MRVAIADDHGIFRSSLAGALRDVGITVPVIAASGDELLARLRGESVDIAIIDVAMPPADAPKASRAQGITTARQLKNEHPTVSVLLLSAETATKQAIDLLRDYEGGIGYLRKDEVTDVNDLYAALERLLTGEQVIGRSVVDRLLRAPRKAAGLERLSPQEKQVLKLMAEGYSNAGIAAQLRLAERTVEDNARRIFVKLDLTPQQVNGKEETNKRVLAVLTWLRLSSTASD